MASETMDVSSVPPRVAGEVDIARFKESSGSAERWRVSISDRVHFLTTADTAWRICSLANASTYAEAYQAYEDFSGEHDSPIEHFIQWAEANRSRIERLHETPDEHPLAWRRKILSEGACQAIGGRSAWLFSPWVWPALFILAAAVIATNAFVPVGGSEGSVWIAVPLVLVGILIHELGHISACVRQGARQGGIGVGLYWIWPAFFADVRGSWSLPRSARLQVSIGGLYFQLLYVAMLAGTCIATGDPSIGVAIRITTILMATTCNPIFKYDGYWILTDIANVTNVHRRIGMHMKRILSGSGSNPYVWFKDRWFWICVAFVVIAGSYLCYISVTLFGVGAGAISTLVPSLREMAGRATSVSASEWMRLAIPFCQAAFVAFALSVLGVKAITAARDAFRD